METGGVAEGENDGAVDVGRHFFDDFFGEGFGLGGCSDQDVWFDFFDDGKEISMVLVFPVRILPSILDLCVGEFVAM